MIGEGGIVVLRGAAFVVEREAGRKKNPIFDHMFISKIALVGSRTRVFKGDGASPTISLLTT